MLSWNFDWPHWSDCQSDKRSILFEFCSWRESNGRAHGRWWGKCVRIFERMSNDVLRLFFHTRDMLGCRPGANELSKSENRCRQTTVDERWELSRTRNNLLYVRPFFLSLHRQMLIESICSSCQCLSVRVMMWIVLISECDGWIVESEGLNLIRLHPLSLQKLSWAFKALEVLSMCH